MSVPPKHEEHEACLCGDTDRGSADVANEYRPALSICQGNQLRLSSGYIPGLNNRFLSAINGPQISVLDSR